MHTIEHVAYRDCKKTVEKHCFYSARNIFKNVAWEFSPYRSIPSFKILPLETHARLCLPRNEIFITLIRKINTHTCESGGVPLGEDINLYSVDCL